MKNTQFKVSGVLFVINSLILHGDFHSVNLTAIPEKTDITDNRIRYIMSSEETFLLFAYKFYMCTGCYIAPEFYIVKNINTTVKEFTIVAGVVDINTDEAISSFRDMFINGRPSYMDTGVLEVEEYGKINCDRFLYILPENDTVVPSALVSVVFQDLYIEDIIDNHPELIPSLFSDLGCAIISTLYQLNPELEGLSMLPSITTVISAYDPVDEEIEDDNGEIVTKIGCSGTQIDCHILMDNFMGTHIERFNSKRIDVEYYNETRIYSCYKTLRDISRRTCTVYDIVSALYSRESASRITIPIATSEEINLSHLGGQHTLSTWYDTMEIVLESPCSFALDGQMLYKKYEEFISDKDGYCSKNPIIIYKMCDFNNSKMKDDAINMLKKFNEYIIIIPYYISSARNDIEFDEEAISDMMAEFFPNKKLVIHAVKRVAKVVVCSVRDVNTKNIILGEDDNGNSDVYETKESTVHTEPPIEDIKQTIDSSDNGGVCTLEVDSREDKKNNSGVITNFINKIIRKRKDDQS